MVGTYTPEKARPLWETWLSYEYNYGDLSAAMKLEKRMSEVYPEGTVAINKSFFGVTANTKFEIDSGMRRFAQRHMYGSHDPIAERDLGYVRPPGGSGSSTSSNGSVKPEAFPTPTPLPVVQPPVKRPPSPPERGRPGPYSEHSDIGPPTKRQREMSPPRERERRDRDRRDVPPPPRRRYGSPDWNRGSPPRRDGHPRDWERDSSSHDDRALVPGPTSLFMGLLPPSTGFDGNVLSLHSVRIVVLSISFQALYSASMT